MEKEEKKGGCCGEEVKAGCCEEKDKTCCGGGISSCCHNWKKCHMMKIIFSLAVILIIFYVGFQCGEMRNDFKRDYGYGRGMMNDGYGRYNDGYGKYNQRQESGVTVDVIKVKEPVTPVTPTTPKQ